MPLPQSRFSKPAISMPALLLPVLLLIGNPGQAEVLYKWLEADGTLTFSPEPPDDKSIAFEKVVSGQGQGLGQGLGQSSNQAISRGQVAQPVSIAASPGSSTELPPGISHGSPSAATTTTAAILRPRANTGLTRSTQKTAHCQELKKRVVSLERLLQTDITNETMDNAVVQMARYQTSFNQACNRLGLR